MGYQKNTKNSKQYDKAKAKEKNLEEHHIHMIIVHSISIPFEIVCSSLKGENIYYLCLL